jgi:hypothetical protein
MDPWITMQAALKVATSVAQLDQLLRGGTVSEALTEFGNALEDSARDHLRESLISPEPRRRIQDAAADLQTAYAAHWRAHTRGLMTVRAGLARSSRLFFPQYRKSLGRVAGTASAVATLRAALGEPPETVRVWVDRVARAVAQERLAGQVLAQYESLSPAGPPRYKLRVSGHGDAPVRRHLVDYFTLERALLPSRLVRPLPDAWRVVDGAVSPRPLAELQEKYDPHFVMAGSDKSVLGPAEAKPGRRDIILMLPADRVVPIYDDSA